MFHCLEFSFANEVMPEVLCPGLPTVRIYRECRELGRETHSLFVEDKWLLTGFPCSTRGLHTHTHMGTLAGFSGLFKKKKDTVERILGRYMVMVDRYNHILSYFTISLILYFIIYIHIHMKF